MSNIQTSEEAFNEGFATGFVWDRFWVPGGPYVFQSYKPEFKQEAEQSNINHDEWLRGWFLGLKKQNPEHPLLKDRKF